jgi:hypothetical protein
VSSETTRLDAQGANGRPNPRGAKHIHFLNSFAAVHAIQIVPQFWVATQLNNAKEECTQAGDQRLRIDVPRHRRTFRSLPVEVAIVPGCWTVTRRRIPCLSDRSSSGDQTGSW